MGQTLDFAQQMAAASEAIKKRMVEVYVGSCHACCRKIVERTPVDTGNLRGSWLTSAGSPKYFTSDNPRNDPDGLIPILENKVVFEKTGLSTPVYFTNGLHYTEYIEFGPEGGSPISRQAPNGMVRITLAEYPFILKDFRGTRNA